MKYPKITSLYKYSGFNEFSLESLINESAWFSKPVLFNDPFDCGVYIDSEKIEESVHEVIIGAYQAIGKGIENIPERDFKIKNEDKKLYEKFREETYKAIQELGIYSLSSINNDILMWGHYADSHKEFCIEYERNSDNILGKEADLVIYQEKLPSISGKDFSQNSEEYLKLILTKSTHWSYEKEWRLIHSKGNKSYLLQCKIKSIIFGLKMNNRNRLTIINIFENRDVIFKEVLKDKHEYLVNIVAL